MAGTERRYTGDVPDEVVGRLREAALRLPDAYEELAWVGVRWRVRTRTFGHVLGVELDGVHHVVLVFRSAGEELEMLLRAGPPFLVLGWGRDAIGLVIDGHTDWEEVGELITESYCALAPKKLVAQVDRPALD